MINLFINLGLLRWIKKKEMRDYFCKMEVNDFSITL